MPTPFSSEDLGRTFDARALTRGRSLVLIGAVEVALDGDAITGTVEDIKLRFQARITPAAQGRRVAFASQCSCRHPGCVHLAATALAALDRFPMLRRAEQQSMFARLDDGLDNGLEKAPAGESQRLAVDLLPGTADAACVVAMSLVGERSGRVTPTSPEKIAADPASGLQEVALARLVGGNQPRTAIASDRAVAVLAQLLKFGLARWQPTGKRLVAGDERSFDSSAPPRLPPRSGVILTAAGPWYVDAATGAVGRIRPRPPAPPPPVLRPRVPSRSRVRGGKGAPTLEALGEQAISDRPLTPTLRLRRLQGPDEFGRLQMLDALTLDFEYGGIATDTDDERQFLRVDGSGGPSFIRRDNAAEAAALDLLQEDGFVQMRVADAGTSRGRRVFVFRGRDASERWQGFMAERLPALQALGWRNLIERDFGPRLVDQVGLYDMHIRDAEHGGFSLELGIEIDGKRVPLLPILSRLIERGGMASARVVDGEVITSLDDGRIVKLPAERIGRLLAIIGDLIEASQRATDGALLLPAAEAPMVLELEDLLTSKWQNAAAIQAYTANFRGEPEIPHVAVGPGFKGDLRPYQQQGVDWLQHLRAHGLSGFLADDMGLGKTAQTIAHIVVEEAAGRLDRPALIVVPTSLVSNWTAELGKFAPRLRVEVLHGLDRHERRGQLGGAHVVITTYTVLSRDIEEMRDLSWHIVVLDEAQSIKSPDAKATRAVCQLDTRTRLCLSGTPIENNLEELWSQFAFLMPGLLGARRDFARRFRGPIEKKGDDKRRLQLVRRIRPFMMRRTKSEVATELPPKHTILRRIALAPDQRELYETIRATLYDRVREQIAATSLARSRIVVLDALLKLRQACCDPRLVKLPSAKLVQSSSKLDDLLDMAGEMIAEGRRILVFSKFTSMLDLIKPRLAEAGIAFVELRGDTRDRAEPVRSFEAGEVPLFLISLKAGGRGLNLTSADTVIHYDPWWNPAVENQASDRAHRIGQTKSVFVFKLIAADTVEERILDLQERKADLANLAFSEEADMAALETDDIDFLFGNEERKAA